MLPRTKHRGSVEHSTWRHRASLHHHWSRTNRKWLHQRSRWNRRYERGTAQAAVNERLPVTSRSTAARRKGRRRRRRCRQWVMSRMTPVSTVSGRSPIPTLTLVDKWRASPASPASPRLNPSYRVSCTNQAASVCGSPNLSTWNRTRALPLPVAIPAIRGQLIPLTRHEIRRLFTGLRHQPPGSRIHLHWSRWRRRHQATAWGLPLSCIMAGVSNGGEDTGSSCRMRPKSAVPTRHASSS